VGLAQAQSTPEYELPPINYSATAPSNRVTALQGVIDEGRLTLHGSTEQATLRRCLDALGVSVDTQVLVFSKTSLQRKRITPQNPRAIYFADDAYVGWVPGGLTEVALSDPGLGLAFYQLDARDPTRPLRFERDAECLSCHGGSLTRNWPGVMVRSVVPDPTGEPITAAGSHLITHESPIADRWGGWYVTGQHGGERHLGNAFAQAGGHTVTLDRESGANVTDLNRFFRTDRYLAADSDIVALMVLEHQVMVHNRLVQGGLRVRKWTHYQAQLAKELGESPSAEPTGTARRVIESEAERILEALLFVNEAPLPTEGIKGSDKFVAAFGKNRRADTEGRSLKDFDLRTRVFRYRCSYMIYSQAFDDLPVVLRHRVAQRMREVLTASEPPKPYRHLAASERQAIREILSQTKPEFALASS